MNQYKMKQQVVSSSDDNSTRQTPTQRASEQEPLFQNLRRIITNHNPEDTDPIRILHEACDKLGMRDMVFQVINDSRPNVILRTELFIDSVLASCSEAKCKNKAKKLVYQKALQVLRRPHLKVVLSTTSCRLQLQSSKKPFQAHHPKKDAHPSTGEVTPIDAHPPTEDVTLIDADPPTEDVTLIDADPPTEDVTLIDADPPTDDMRIVEVVNPASCPPVRQGRSSTDDINEDEMNSMTQVYVQRIVKKQSHFRMLRQIIPTYIQKCNNNAAEIVSLACSKARMRIEIRFHPIMKKSCDFYLNSVFISTGDGNSKKLCKRNAFENGLQVLTKPYSRVILTSVARLELQTSDVPFSGYHVSKETEVAMKEIGATHARNLGRPVTDVKNDSNRLNRNTTGSDPRKTCLVNSIVFSESAAPTLWMQVMQEI